MLLSYAVSPISRPRTKRPLRSLRAFGCGLSSAIARVRLLDHDDRVDLADVAAGRIRVRRERVEAPHHDVERTRARRRVATVRARADRRDALEIDVRRLVLGAVAE